MPLHQYLTPWQRRSLVGPWFVVHCKPTARFISQLSGHFLLYSVLKIPVRRADVEKLGCLSFRCFKKKHKTLPPLSPPPPDTLPTGHICLLKQTYMCCNLKVPLPPSQKTHTRTQLIPPLPPCRAGLIILGMDSWHPDFFSEMHEFRREAHTLCFAPAPFFALLLELGLGEKGNKPHNRNQLAQRQPFCYSLSAHTSVGARERGRGLWETQGVW